MRNPSPKPLSSLRMNQGDVVPPMAPLRLPEVSSASSLSRSTDSWPALRTFSSPIGGYEERNSIKFATKVSTNGCHVLDVKSYRITAFNGQGSKVNQRNKIKSLKNITDREK